MTQDIPKLDATLKTAEERTALVHEICEKTPLEMLTPYYCEIMSNYILDAIPRTEVDKTFVTTNRKKTIDKRETSYQGLAEKLENGEDGLYNMISDAGKGAFLDVKDPITEQDIAEIPDLKILTDEIKKVEELKKLAKGKKKFLLNQQIIQMRQDQYVIKSAYKKPIYCTKLVKSFNKFDLGEKVTITDKGEVISDGIITLYDAKHISALLCNYSSLKQSTAGRFSSDAYYMMMDLDNLIEKTLKYDHPLYYRLVQCKIDGDTNIEIQNTLNAEFGIKHSIEYISSLWRNKIPKMLAEQAQEDYLVWYFTEKERGRWKKCNRCGEIKLAHNRFFSKNTSSKDNLYSICKKCRNKKGKE